MLGEQEAKALQDAAGLSQPGKQVYAFVSAANREHQRRA